MKGFPMAKGDRYKWLVLAALVVVMLITILWQPNWRTGNAADRPALALGSRSEEVGQVQERLSQWGYYRGNVNGFYGLGTWRAVRAFQRDNGILADGTVGPKTWSALGITAVPRLAGTAASRPLRVVSRGESDRDDVYLLARVIQGEAGGEPYVGKVAVGAVIMNRINNPNFPHTIPGVIFQPYAFESVSNGIIWNPVSSDSVRAAVDAVSGWDPTYGAIYFWNPSKPVNPWIWTRVITTQIGNHIFAR